jgi:DNA polymerase-1
MRLVNLIPKDALFIIDGSACLYRSYYGIKPLHSSKGVPCQAIYGFCRALKNLVSDYNPKHLIIVWDSKGKTTRAEIFPEYKATRLAPPSDLFEQKEAIQKFAELVGIKQLSMTGHEADDLIASLVRDFPDKQIVLVGSDKDLQQLLCDHVTVLDPMKKEVVDVPAFITKYEFKPEQLPFYHALLGDASDNIPGVKGIGKKTAQEIVQQFATLEELYEQLATTTKLKPRIIELLQMQKENAFLSLKLFLLHDIDLALTLHDLSYDAHLWPRANDFFAEYEFRSFMVHDTKPATPTTLPKAIAQTPAPIENWNCSTIQTKTELDELYALLEQQKVLAVDTETTGLDPLQDQLLGISISFNSKSSYYIPLHQKPKIIEQQLSFFDAPKVDPESLNQEVILATLKPIFENNKIEKTLHNAKFDQLVLYNAGINLRGIAFDSLLAANLLRREWQKIGLKSLSLQLLNEPMTDFKELLGKQYKTFAEVPLELGAHYAAHDALQTLKLTTLFQKELAAEPILQKLLFEMELPLNQILFEMECSGILLKPEALKVIEHEVDKDLLVIMHKIAGFLESIGKPGLEGINLGSPKQVEKLLFDDLELKSQRKGTSGQRSTDQDVLIELSKVHPIPMLILKYRELAKLKSTYLQPLPLAVNPKTNRIHTSFSQTIAATGRLSSTNPNLQNIPSVSDYGIRIRGAFIAAPGTIFLSADYSQIELRILAHITKDPGLVDAFLHNKDIHTQTAAQLFDVAQADVTRDQRALGKRINFSIMYGMTPYGLAQDLEISPAQAKKYIEMYFEQYPQVSAWMKAEIEQAKELGYTQTLWGRRRYLGGLHEKNKNLYEAACRAAINTPIQGSAADLIKMAMIAIDQEFKALNLKAKMLLQIHDELLLEIPIDEVAQVKTIVKRCMEDIVTWNVPLEVSLREGQNWEEITK